MDRLESLGELIELYRRGPGERGIAYSSEFLAATICREVGQFWRLRAAAEAEDAELESAEDMQNAEALIHEAPSLLDKALDSIDPDVMVRAMRRYLEEHPVGDDEDEGFRLLFDYDCAHLVASVARKAHDRLSPAGRVHLDKVDRSLQETAEHVRRSPSAFRRVADALAAYCRDWAVEPDHPMASVVDACTPWVEALLAERAVAAREAEHALAVVEARAGAESTHGPSWREMFRIPELVATLRERPWSVLVRGRELVEATTEELRERLAAMAQTLVPPVAAPGVVRAAGPRGPRVITVQLLAAEGAPVGELVGTLLLGPRIEAGEFQMVLELPDFRFAGRDAWVAIDLSEDEVCVIPAHVEANVISIKTRIAPAVRIEPPVSVAVRVAGLEQHDAGA